MPADLPRNSPRLFSAAYHGPRSESTTRGQGPENPPSVAYFVEEVYVKPDPQESGADRARIEAYDAEKEILVILKVDSLHLADIVRDARGLGLVE